MSFIWMKQKIFTSKQFDSYLGKKPFELKLDDVVPQELRKSLFSVDGERNGDLLENEEDDEETFEPANNCSDDCSHSSCPFRPNDNIFVPSRSQHSTSKASLLRVVSSMSVFESTVYERSSFINIDKLIPVRNHSVIIHWTVKSTYGVRGFMVFLDGKVVCKIFSSARTTALVKNVDMKLPHYFAIAIIHNEDDRCYKNVVRKLSQIEPATYIHKP